jgi:hypothetical protein
VFLDHQTRPDEGEQLAFFDDAIAMPGQHEQQVEGPAAERGRLAGDAQHALGRVQLEMLEAQHVVDVSA